MPSLFPSEQEIARRILGPGREKAWPAIAQVLEKRGFPPINPLLGGRYWPSVEAFFAVDNGLPLKQVPSPPSAPGVKIVAPKPDGVETFDAPKAQPYDRRRSPTRA